MMKINYFFSTWSGSRRHGFTFGNYTHQHLQFLSHFANNLSQITIGWPYNPDEKRPYHQYMTKLDGSEINGVPIRIVRTNNEGKSYGQFAQAIKDFPDFDYYIYTEDDYVPVANNFDQLLLDKYKRTDCDYLCGWVKDKPLHAAVSWGIMSREVLEKVCKDNFKDQISFSRSFIKAGLKIADLTDEYYVPYDSCQGIKDYGKSYNPKIFYPIEHAKMDFELEVLFRDNDPCYELPSSSKL